MNKISEVKNILRRLCLIAGVFIINTSLLFAQEEITVFGIVKDAINSEPIVGANVYTKGGTVGVITDKDGKYSIVLPKGETVLIFSYLGYIAQEIKVNNSANIDVTMNEDVQSLHTVVVVGFGTQKKINLTGAVSVIDSKAFESIPVQNAVQALQGKIPGLNITQTQGGQLDAVTDFDIRGLGTIGDGSSGAPLILIDGMEGSLYSINPQDIESISVLKDAASSSIYGGRAAFGVVLVTTKKAKQGKVSVNYNNSFRYNAPINMSRQMDSYTWALFFNDASLNAGRGYWVYPERLQRIKDYMEGKIDYNTIPNPDNPNYWGNAYDHGNDNINYYDVYFKKITHSQEHNISATGGNDNINYYLSGNYLYQDGLMRVGGDGLNRYNLFGKIGTKMSRFVSLDYTTRFTRTDYHKPTHMTDWFFQEIGRQSWPVGPLYDPNGFLFNDHVLQMREGGQTKSQDYTSLHQLTLTLEPIKGCRIMADLNYRNSSYFVHTTLLSVHQMQVDGVNIGGVWDENSRVSEFIRKTDCLNINVYGDYEKSFGNGHHIKVLAGFQSENNNVRDLYGERLGVMVPNVPTINTTTGMDSQGNIVAPNISGGYWSFADAGYFGRLNYNFKEKYLLETNLRYHGSSRFRSNNRWGLFPSLSIGWNIAKEDFFKDIQRVINTLKLRTSYGLLGNQNTNNAYPTYSVMGYSMAGGTWLMGDDRPNVSWPPQSISTSLTWEKVQTINAGLDFGLFNNRLTGSFDYFIRKTLNMIGPADELPVILGTDVPNTNNTDLRTNGFELELSWKDQIFNELNYGLRFVLSDNQTVITRYSNPSATLSKYYAGMKWGEIWGYETIGIAQTDEEMFAHLATLPNGGQNIIGQNWQAGDIMYADINNDGKIDFGANTIDDHGDLKIIGNSSARFNFGFDVSADWKGFDFKLFLQGVGKRDYFQNSYYFWGFGNWLSIGLTQHADYFRNDTNHPLGLNLNSYYPRPLWGVAKNQQIQSRYLQNAAYLRLKNIQIGYTLPSFHTEKIGIGKLRLFISGENLLTFTKMTTLFDPETISGNFRGNVYPLSKVYSFGLNVTL